MSQVAKYQAALQLLRELNCPSVIIEALECWGMFVREDEAKLCKWESLSAVEAEWVRKNPTRFITARL